MVLREGGVALIEQIGISLFGVIAVWLTQDKRPSWRRWACIFGLAGQPFWIYYAWNTKAWGILIICGLYLYAWAKGVWVNWLSEDGPPT